MVDAKVNLAAVFGKQCGPEQFLVRNIHRHDILRLERRQFGLRAHIIIFFVDFVFTLKPYGFSKRQKPVQQGKSAAERVPVGISVGQN